MARRLEVELNTAKQLALEAGKVILRIYQMDFQVEFKGKDDPVTQADREANDLITRGLSAKFGADSVVGEESDLSAKEWVGKSRIWYVDPVDGTREFVERNGQFAVQIGLAIDGRAELGVVYQPTTGRLYSGIVSQGAWLELNGETTPLRVSANADLSEARIVHTRSHRSEALQTMMNALGKPEGIPTGSVGLKTGKIAETEADLYLETTSHSKGWDSCGPEAILKAAGGELTDLRGNAITYGTAELRNLHGMLGTNGVLHAQVAERIRDLLPRFGL